MNDQVLMILLPIIFGLFGLILGSFTTSMSYRYIEHIKFNFKDRSICPKCKANIKWYDNIPLFSYIFLKGRCRNCHEKISISYPLIELSMCLLFLLTYFKHFYFISIFIFTFNALNLVNSIIFSLLIFFLINVLLVDKKTLEIPLFFNISIFVLSDIYFIFNSIMTSNWSLINIIGAGAAIIIFGIILLISKLIKKELIGLGDVILIISLSLILGIYTFILFILIASLSAAIIEIIKSKKNKEQKEFPFGPYLAISAILCFFFFDFINMNLSNLF